MSFSGSLGASSKFWLLNMPLLPPVSMMNLHQQAHIVELKKQRYHASEKTKVITLQMNLRKLIILLRVNATRRPALHAWIYKQGYALFQICIRNHKKVSLVAEYFIGWRVAQASFVPASRWALRKQNLYFSHVSY